MKLPFPRPVPGGFVLVLLLPEYLPPSPLSWLEGWPSPLLLPELPLLLPPLLPAALLLPELLPLLPPLLLPLLWLLEDNGVVRIAGRPTELLRAP